MSMSISYEETGRRRQKARTRRGLIAAARDLLARGGASTVEAAAAAAGVSRATAYRYFPNQRALLVAAHPEAGKTSLLGPVPPADPEARVDAVVRGLAEMFLAAEATYRTMLRLALEPKAEDRGTLPLREGLRMVWITEALEPLRERLTGPELSRLTHALASAIGIEALVVLTDLAHLSPTEAVEVMRWSARALLRSALAEADARRPDRP